MPTSTSDLQRSPSLRLLSRFKSLKRNSLSNGVPQVVNFDFESRTPRPRLLSLESLMSYGLGSDVGGETISEMLCGNQVHVRGSRTRQRRCTKRGVFSCPKCHLIRYCSENCQKHHWSYHSSICANHPYLDANWQPSWVLENRDPEFISAHEGKTDAYPAIDILQVNHNDSEGTHESKNRDFNLCFTSSNDIRSLIKTINSLPKEYTGRCSVLFNSSGDADINRSLVILYTLCASGPSIDESAELATHLLYSRFLTPQQAGYVRTCVDYIYGSGSGSGDEVNRTSMSMSMSFRATLPTRAQENGTGKGKGKNNLSSVQTAVGPRQILETFANSKWERERCSMPVDEFEGDTWELFISKLKPSHRLAFQTYRDSGVLLPFALGLDRSRCKRVFSEPNRLLLTPSGTINPLRGWDIDAILQSGEKHGVDPTDLFGCLFFHVKDELKEFARRMRDFRIEVLLTQFDERVLVRGLGDGMLGFQGFDSNSGVSRVVFDRILVEKPDCGSGLGMKECLGNWAPLLNSRNPHSSLLMCVTGAGRDAAYYSSSSSSWGTRTTSPTIRNPLAAIVRKYSEWVAHPKLKLELRSPKHVRLMEPLDGLYVRDKDYDEEFLDEDVESFGVYRRMRNLQLGVPLEATVHQEQNELATICQVNLSVRFIEFAKRA